MIEGNVETPPEKAIALKQWKALLHDEPALLKAPGAHHKALLSLAHALYKIGEIDSDDLSDLLEQADGALAYAIESLLDIDQDE
ncbi:MULTISPECIES: hypothetical protein [unclassified Pseudomonas]|uniref:hypothetical protein n=1 Tax=unclassified Pseudomonas TaxID=196821 RepID=UPI0030DC1665